MTSGCVRNNDTKSNGSTKIISIRKQHPDFDVPEIRCRPSGSRDARDMKAKRPGEEGSLREQFAWTYGHLAMAHAAIDGGCDAIRVGATT